MQKKESSMQRDNTQTLWQVVKGYFNAFPEKDCEDEVVAQISDGVDFHGATLWVLIFAIFIASLGLNVNSTAVINRCHAHIATDGTNHWNGLSSGHSRP